MGTTKTLGDIAARDYVTDSVPSSGVNQPNKADMRAAFADADTRLGAIEIDIPARDAANVKLTGNQTIAGLKTFASALAIAVATEDYHAVTKAQLDAKADGYKMAAGGAVRVAIAAALAANTYANGTAGVGATLTATANGALPSIDGVSLSVGNRLWVWDYTGANGADLKYGIYTVTSLGSAGAPWVLTRATDADTAAELDKIGCYVLSGTANSGRTIVLPLAVGAITVGTTALNPGIFGSATSVAAEAAARAAADVTLQTNIDNVLGQVVNVGTIPAVTSGTSWAVSQAAVSLNAVSASSGVIKEIHVGSQYGLTGYAVVSDKTGASSPYTFTHALKKYRFKTAPGVGVATGLAIPYTAGQFLTLYLDNQGIYYQGTGPGGFYNTNNIPLAATTSMNFAGSVNPNIGFVVAVAGGKDIAVGAVNATDHEARITDVERLIAADTYDALLTNECFRIDVIGDSNIERAFAVTSLIPSTVSSGWVTWLENFFPFINMQVWVDAGDTLSRNFTGMNFGKSGETAQAVIASGRHANLLDHRVNIAIASLGTNDVWNGRAQASLQADLLAMYTKLLSAPALIVCTIPPVGAAYANYTAGRQTARQTTNTWIRSYAASTPRVWLLDIDALLDDGAGFMSTTYSDDLIHTNQKGAQRVGASANAIVAKIAPNYRFLPRTKNLVANPSLLSNLGSGVVGSSVSGTVADGMNVRWVTTGGSSAVASLVALPDGRNSQRLVITPSGAAAYDRLIFTPNGDRVSIPVEFANKWVRAHVKVTVNSWNGWRGVGLYTNNAGLGNQFAFSTDTMDGGLTFWIRTPPFLYGATPTNPTIYFADIGVKPVGATGTGQIDISDIWYGEVPDPRVGLNF